MGYTDKELINFLSDVDSGKRKIADIDNYMQNAADSSSAFAATLKTVAANMAIMIGINLAIKGLAWVYDQIAHRQENLNNAAIESANAFKESESQIKSTNSELKTTESRIRELEAKPSLSFVEQEELDKLRQQNEELVGSFIPCLNCLNIVLFLLFVEFSLICNMPEQFVRCQKYPYRVCGTDAGFHELEH